jgi:thioredoxin-like negative regulator of GroEL
MNILSADWSRAVRSKAGTMQLELMGSAAASAAVRRALAANPGMHARTKQLADWVHAVGREGAAHCARGGRAPQINRIVG